MKFKLSVLIVALFALSAVVFGQKETVKPATPTKPVETKTPAAKLPTVREILDKYVQALGGRAANEKIKTRLTKGTIELAPVGISGTVEIYTSAPDKSYAKSNLKGIGEIIEGFDGTTAWSINPLQGNRDKDGAELLQTKLTNNFYREINLDKLYPKMTVEKMEKVGDKDVYVVVATPVGLDPETFYFDTKTGLLIRADSTIISPEGKMPAKSFYDDYREVDGVKVAHKFRVVLPQFEILTTITEVKNNVTVDSAMFSKPKS